MLILTKRYCIKAAYILIDFFCIGLSIWVAAMLRHHTLPFDITLENLFISSVNPFKYIFFFWMIVTITLNNSNGLYETKREMGETVEIWRVIKSVFISTLIVIVAVYVSKAEGFPRTVCALTSMFMVVLLSIWRMAKRALVNYLVSNGYNNFNVLIIGAGKVGTSLKTELHSNPGLGLKVVGYLDDFKHSDKKNNIRILGKIPDFKKVVQHEFIQIVYLTIHLDEKIFVQILEDIKELGIALRVIPHGYELLPGKFAKTNVGLIPVIEYSDTKTFKYQAGKRIFDFVFSLLAFIFLLPLLIVISISIAISSPGPIFHVSKRYGRGGRMFNMYKFRSMVRDAEKQFDSLKDQNEVDGPIFKMKADPRVTKCGRFLRKYSLDELPQLLNVLIGDMSLVGPRPLPIEQIQKEDLRQLMRLEVRPGITGLWQVRGRSNLSFTRLVRWDVWYINNWSFWLDINILAQTLPVVVKGRGAY